MSPDAHMTNYMSYSPSATHTKKQLMSGWLTVLFTAVKGYENVSAEVFQQKKKRLGFAHQSLTSVFTLTLPPTKVDIFNY